MSLFNAATVSVVKRQAPKTWKPPVTGRKKRTDYEIYKHKLHMISKTSMLDYVDTNSKNIKYRRDLAASLKKRGVFLPVYLPSWRHWWIHTLHTLSYLLNVVKENFHYLYTKNRSVLTPRDREVLEMVAWMMWIDTANIKKKPIAYRQD